MSDLISREEAIKAMVKLEEDDIKMYGGVFIPEGFDSNPAVEALNSLQTVNAVPIERLFKIIKEIEEMVCDVNVEEIKSYDTDLALRGWTLAWGNRMMCLLEKIKKGLE